MSAKSTLRTLTSIVAIDLRGAIGCDNTLPWRLKSDMAFFRQNTLGNTVIMGRKTYNSLGSKPLPRRNNIVLSHNNVLFEAVPSCQLALSVEEALFLAEKNGDDEIFVIGGAQTYEQFDFIVDRYLVTIVDHEVPNADAHLSDRVLNSFREWDRVEIDSFVASAEQDEFAFSIFEVSAPDSDTRRAVRRQMIESYGQKITPKKAPKGAPRSRLAISQDAFAF
jgi:dihydrofolate reductase